MSTAHWKPPTPAGAPTSAISSDQHVIQPHSSYLRARQLQHAVRAAKPPVRHHCLSAFTTPCTTPARWRRGQRCTTAGRGLNTPLLRSRSQPAPQQRAAAATASCLHGCQPNSATAPLQGCAPAQAAASAGRTHPSARALLTRTVLLLTPPVCLLHLCSVPPPPPPAAEGRASARHHRLRADQARYTLHKSPRRRHITACRHTPAGHPAPPPTPHTSILRLTGASALREPAVPTRPTARSSAPPSTRASSARWPPPQRRLGPHYKK
jgi:hypothetical protein